MIRPAMLVFFGKYEINIYCIYVIRRAQVDRNLITTMLMNVRTNENDARSVKIPNRPRVKTHFRDKPNRVFHRKRQNR